MTIIEAIQANPVFALISAEQIEYVLKSRSIEGAASFDESSLKSVELVSADLYTELALMPSFKEGQLAINYDPALLKNRALSIYLKYDDAKASDLQPKVVNVGITDASDVA